MIHVCTLTDLPTSAQNLVRLIGLPKSVRLIEQLGGTTFPVAKAINSLGKLRYELLAEAVGVDAADILTAEYGGEMLYIPNCAAALRAVRNRAIHTEFDAMTSSVSNPVYSTNEALVKLAITYRLSDRRIWDILKVLPDQPAAQPQLF
ncbi:MAG: Mor transcription activator family protein [Halothiobacillus sp.]